METRDNVIFKRYKSARNAVSREIRKITRDEQLDVATQCKKNPKKFWNYVNSKRNSKSAVGDLLSTDAHGNNVVVSTDEEKAKALKMHLSRVFTTEEKTTYNSSNVNRNATSSSFKDINFCKDSILHKLSQLNPSKSPGPDSFYSRVLFEIRHEILEPLQRLFTTSYCLRKLLAD